MITTKNGVGKLSAKMWIPLASYTSEPVTVRLDDTNTQPIVRRLIPSLTPSGTPPKKWQFKSRADGLQKVLLKPDAAMPGQFKLTVKAKHWFAFTNGADQTDPANTDLTVTIGGRASRTRRRRRSTERPARAARAAASARRYTWRRTARADLPVARAIASA